MYLAPNIERLKRLRLVGYALKEQIAFCPSCDFQYEPKTMGKNECPTCRCDLHVTTMSMELIELVSRDIPTRHGFSFTHSARNVNTYILNADGEPEVCPDVIAWGRWFDAHTAQRIVASDTLPGDVLVSTVFLGLDYSFGGRVPILYETLIVRGAHDGYQTRYATRAAAEHGHKRALALATSVNAGQHA